MPSFYLGSDDDRSIYLAGRVSVTVTVTVTVTQTPARHPPHTSFKKGREEEEEEEAGIVGDWPEFCYLLIYAVLPTHYCLHSDLESPHQASPIPGHALPPRSGPDRSSPPAPPHSWSSWASFMPDAMATPVTLGT
ncbi:hypothetical protein BO71DRAFT_399348 [Aspergillus ellipticus CBS 707.79]|uniref:Uncharacterized protein n=1 Tax=Aspergillus ellipticus CBS 707.79 TaxID=1448320 RepID=A0A319D9B7_9EURO|nr:hypothetical protein BO71DRAFT_399348 [Aspergillus ellipticus CBS 707.79]